MQKIISSCLQNNSNNNTSAHVQKKNGGKSRTGELAGLAAYGAFDSLSLHTSRKIASHIAKNSDSLNKAQIDLINKAADNVLKATKLEKPYPVGIGVKIINITPDFKTKDIFDKKWQKRLNHIKYDGNAIFKTGNIKDKNGKAVLKGPLILINREETPLPVFHEIGHAINYRERINTCTNTMGTKIKNVLEKPLKNKYAASALLAAYCACTSDKKQEEGKELTLKDKIYNASRKLAPFAAIRMFVPELKEEATATIKGGKYVPKELLKEYKNRMTLSFATYAIPAIGASLGIWAARKLKDGFDESRTQKE